jgi:2-dehydro-3-deoxyphosphogluconate aldolase/(4S)-4-hydroxy-2-oxoglutarate aldolase
MSLDRPVLPAELTDTGVMAIARAASASLVAAAVERLVDAGVTCIELTLTMPDAVASIASLSRRFATRAVIGAGTVLTADQARACVDAGARFLVAPSAVPDVLEFAVDNGIPCLPGALTPSEIVTAWQAGAAAVKLFPASLGGPSYLRDVRAPLPHVPIVPTGGVRLDDVATFVTSGAVAVGLGTPLFGDALAGGDLDALATRAAAALDGVRAGRAAGRGHSS